MEKLVKYDSDDEFSQNNTDEVENRLYFDSNSVHSSIPIILPLFLLT